LGSEKPPVVGAGLQDHQAGPAGDIPIEPAEHRAGRVEWNSSIDDLGVDSPGLQKERQPSRVRALIAHIPTLRIARADGDNSKGPRFGRVQTSQDHKAGKEQSDLPGS
jgi:hypothetical protein